MTDSTPAPDRLARVETPHGSRLEQLHEAYAGAKAAAEEATTRLKAITDALKVELTQAAPEGASRIELVGEAGPRLRLTYSESWRLDSRQLKAEDPETYVRYAKKSGSWTLKEGGGA
jgi:hypothetical protein